MRSATSELKIGTALEEGPTEGTRRRIEKRQEVITETEKQANEKNEKQGGGAGGGRRYESIHIRNEDLQNEEEKQVSRRSRVGS